MMFRAEAIDGLVTLLTRRRAHAFHACQLEDFYSYVTLGGIPARNLLERSGLAHTSFTSDETDQLYGVFDKVFGNLQDFGRFFAYGAAATPCLYGPILLVLRPTCFTAADDVAICLRSASGVAFNRERESLSTVEQVDSLYVDDSSPYPYSIRRSQELAQLFPGIKDVGLPEVSLSIPDELLPLEHVQYILVDPYYSPTGRSLIDVVRVAIASDPDAPNIPVYVRNQGRRERLALYRILGDRLMHSAPSLNQLRQDPDAPADLREWAEAASRTGAAEQYRRAYMPYLRAGTLRLLADQDSDEPADLPF